MVTSGLDVYMSVKNWGNIPALSFRGIPENVMGIT